MKIQETKTCGDHYATSLPGKDVSHKEDTNDGYFIVEDVWLHKAEVYGRS